MVPKGESVNCKEWRSCHNCNRRKGLHSAKGRSRGLGAKPEGTAYEGIPALVEAETAVSCPRNTDPGADTDRPHRLRGAAKPEPALPRAEINAIEAFIDFQCRGKAPRAACQVKQARNPSVTLHPSNSVQRLKRADQGASPHTGHFACDVKEPAGSVGETNVRRAMSKKQGGVRLRVTRKSVARGVANRIGFGLDDPPADPALRKVVDKCLADQEACELDRVDGQLGSANPPDASGPCWRRVCIHAIAQLTAEPFARRARPDTTDENTSRPGTPGKIKLTARSYQENEYQSRLTK